MSNEVLITFFQAHLVADFPLQTNYLFQVKRKSTVGLLLHVSIHALTAFLLTGLRLDLWYVWFYLLVSHALIDWGKLQYKSSKQWGSFLLDQLAHFLIMIVITLWQPGLTRVLSTEILYSSFLLAWIPAILIFLWIYSVDVNRTKPNPPGWVVCMQKKYAANIKDIWVSYPVNCIVWHNPNLRGCMINYAI